MIFSEGFAKIIHPIFEVLGYFVGFHYYLLIKKKTPIPDLDKYRVWILLATVLGALIFSRVVAIFEHIHLIDDATPLSFYIGQKTIVGGLLGGLLFIEITKKILNIKRSTGDQMTKPLLVGLVIGRLGCFLSGIYDGTHGIETNFLFGIDLGDGIKRHPVQIYEIIFLLILFTIILTLEKLKLKLRDGFLFKLFLFSYLGFRFLIEFIKPVQVFWIGLSFIQLVCLAGIFYYLLLLQLFLLKGKKRYE